MKTHIRRWVNEGHDATTADEMKVALESHGGVRGCRFAVVEIDKTKMNAEVSKIPGISFLNNFHFNDDDMVSGPGKLTRLERAIFIPMLQL